MLWGKMIVRLISRRSAPEFYGGTEKYTLENCLSFSRKTVPNFDQCVAGKNILDYGCGHGWQAVAMRKTCGARSVFGVDIIESNIEFASALAQQHECGDCVRFGLTIPEELRGTFDVVASISAFEHYPNPGQEIQRMRSYLKPSGVLIISFAEPWFSPFGSHFSGYTRIPGTSLPVPWLNLLLRDRALLSLRSQFRTDRPSRLEDVAGGLNRMTVSKFERLIRDSGMAVESMQLFAVKGIPLVTRIPVLRELFTNAASSVLRCDQDRS